MTAPKVMLNAKKEIGATPPPPPHVIMAYYSISIAIRIQSSIGTLLAPRAQRRHDSERLALPTHPT